MNKNFLVVFWFEKNNRERYPEKKMIEIFSIMNISGETLSDVIKKEEKESIFFFCRNADEVN